MSSQVDDGRSHVIDMFPKADGSLLLNVRALFNYLMISAIAVGFTLGATIQAHAADAAKVVTKASPSVPVAVRPPAVTTDVTTPATASKRTLSFPEDRSIGTLLLLPPDRKIRTAYKQISGAKGKVEVDVPKDNLLIFEPNQKTFLHPELLDNVSANAVDGLKISFLSMDSKEDTLCNTLLKHLSRFPNATILCVADSDATDSGLVSALHFPHLKELITTHSNTHGRFLQNAASLRLVNFMDIGDCPIDADSYKYLPSLKNLTGICLAKNNLNANNLNDLAACPNLTLLDISGIPKIDDTCVKSLLRFKSLQALNLSGTSITFQGLKSLSPLKLKRVWLPRANYSDSEMATLAKLFGTIIAPNDLKTRRRRDLETILAPTGRVKGMH